MLACALRRGLLFRDAEDGREDGPRGTFARSRKPVRLRCPSHGVSFMVSAKWPRGHRKIVYFAIDTRSLLVYNTIDTEEPEE